MEIEGQEIKSKMNEENLMLQDLCKREIRVDLTQFTEWDLWSLVFIIHGAGLDEEALEEHREKNPNGVFIKEQWSFYVKLGVNKQKKAPKNMWVKKRESNAYVSLQCK